jgi:hypothetical protein
MKNCSNKLLGAEDMNIFDMANQNSDNLKTQYKLLKERHEDQNNLDILSNFVKLVKDKWAISINMGLGTLNIFLIAGRYKNIYEVKKEQGEELRKVRELEISDEQAVKNHLKGYYQSRVTFNRTVEDGEKFKYGALNIGCLGLKGYGEYCVMLKREQLEEYSSLAFVKGDSLNYVDEHHVNERLSQDIANKDCVHALVALKHETDIVRFSADKWASMICCDESYIEAITTDEIENGLIGSVRMSKTDYDRYFIDYLYKDFASEISEDEMLKLRMLEGIIKLLDARGIKLEVIDEDGN